MSELNDADDMTDDMTEAEADEPESGLLAAARQAYVRRAAEPPSELVAAPMRTVARELRPARRLAVPPGFVTDLAVANAVRLVLDGDPAVIARRCRVADDGAGWRVELTVAASYRHYERHGDTLIRTRVVEAVDDLFGAAVTTVDIDIVDVFTERPRAAR